MRFVPVQFREPDPYRFEAARRQSLSSSATGRDRAFSGAARDPGSTCRPRWVRHPGSLQGSRNSLAPDCTEVERIEVGLVQLTTWASRPGLFLGGRVHALVSPGLPKLHGSVLVLRHTGTLVPVAVDRTVTVGRGEGEVGGPSKVVKSVLIVCTTRSPNRTGWIQKLPSGSQEIVFGIS